MTTPHLTTGEVARLVGATLHGDASIEVSDVASLRSATPSDLAFCAGAAHRRALRETRAAAVLVPEDLLGDCPVPALVVDDPYRAFAVVAARLRPASKPTPGIHPSASVAANARVADSVHVGPNTVIGSGVWIGEGTEIGAGCVIDDAAMIGPGCVLRPGVYVGEGCRLRKRVIVHAGAVIGSDGFGYAPTAAGWQKVPQLGAVRIGDDVEIGANATIDRGALDDTVIGTGVKIDNLVHIAHNVIIGAHTAIAGSTVIAGSTIIGRNCMIGGASAITGHIEITDGVTITGMTGVTGNIHEPGVYASPIPAHPVRQWRRNAVRFTQLDDIYRRLVALERAGVDKPANEEIS